VNSPL